MEIERKFTIRQLPDKLSSYTCLHMEQAYLCTDPVVRIRKENDNYYLTYKGKGLLAREEANLPLHEEGYAHLLTKADGLIIQKDRYLIPIETPSFDMEALKDCGITTLPNNLQLTIELDIFQSPSGLIMAEVEFPSIELANAYRMPDWFAEDVTQNKAYHNSNISKGGPVFDPTPSFLEDGN
jgi:CYTH domain-containing protein